MMLKRVIYINNLVPNPRRKNMQKIRSKDTSIELIIRKKLWAKGYRYKKNCVDLPGKPDIVFSKYKLVIFCDSEFFHGKNWDKLKERIKKGKNAKYWLQKIERNRVRDEEINKILQQEGWFVLRLWGDMIKEKPDECVEIIEGTIRNIYGPIV